MKGTTAGAIALALVIPLTGCPYAAYLLVGCVGAAAEQSGGICGGGGGGRDPRQEPPDLTQYRWVDKEGRLRVTTKHGLTIVPGEYLILLNENTDASSITEVFGKHGIKSIKHITDDPQRKSFFLLTFTEIGDPGQVQMGSFARYNQHLFSELTPNYSYPP